MKGLEFPIVGSKVKGLNKKFDINSPAGRKEYFEAKVGNEIGHIKEYLENNTFIAYLLGKKNSGKGTYSKLFTEIFGEDKVEHVSVGDVVRLYHGNWNKFKKKREYEKLKSHYRGFMSFKEAEDALLGRSTAKLLPTEFILALLKLHISNFEGKTIFLDGLPRELDQVSYSLYFRDLINYRDDPDIFVLIDIPEAVINERIKYRVICPKCHTSRNKKLLVTSNLKYDEKKKEFLVLCDNESCDGSVMVGKEGDDKGIGPIKKRLKLDEDILRRAFFLHGVPKVFLRNHVPVKEAKKYFDDYEITPEFVLERDKNNEVRVSEKPWSIKDDNGVESYSLMSTPVMVSMIKQLAGELDVL